MNKLKAAALRYADMSLRVFPAEPGGKRPCIKAWPENATTDPDQIEKWWDQWPEANVAIATGRGSGIVVVDVDVKRGVNGAASLAQLGWPLDGSPLVQTPTGGHHYYLRHPGPGHVVGNRSGLAPGIDLRGDGGYVIAPPSRLGPKNG